MRCPLCKKEFENIDDFMKHLDDPVCLMVLNNDINGLLIEAQKE